MPLTRRRFLRNMSMTGAAVRVGLPPLAAMFDSNGTAYAATAADAAVPMRFVFWFNGNGIPERYWIPTTTGADYELTPCLAPLEPVRNDIHLISGIDNPNARVTAPGNTHHKSMSALVSGMPYTGRGAGGPSIDQVIAGAMPGETRFRSLQVGVCQESHGENIHRNLSWAGADRALPPEMIPHNLFDRLFGVRDQSWIDRKKSVLDAVREDLAGLHGSLGQSDRHRLDEHLTSVREVERAIASLPGDYGRNIKEPEDVADLTDYPRIAKIQSDLVAHALSAGQTRVVSYMLTKCQSLTRLPWLGYTRLRHHDYTHTNAESPEGQRTMRDICRWHVEEFAYLVQRLKAIPEGDGTLLDHTCLVFAHEHAEANPHKDNGLALILAGHAGAMKTGLHSKMRHTAGDLYLTVAEEVLKLPLEKGFPTAEKKISGIV
jgi:uncharacterized protein DUF1552